MGQMEGQICNNGIILAALTKVGRTQSKIWRLSKEGENHNKNIFMKAVLCNSIKKYKKNMRFKGNIFKQSNRVVI